MIQVAKADVLRGLKKFKRLAKQDFLASGLTSDPKFWSRQAEARRKTYDELMDQVNNEGVEPAYEGAISAYADLPLQHAQDDPEVKGREQAYEMFFAIVGVESEQVRGDVADKHAGNGEVAVNAAP